MSDAVTPGFRAGHGDPLVLLHGFVSSWEAWRPILPDLVTRYDVSALALPGHLGGPALTGQLTFNHAVDVVERQLDDLGIDTAHIVGNSMGGAVAVALAARGRARTVVGLSPAGGWDPNGPEPERIADFFARRLEETQRAEPYLRLIMKFALLRRLALHTVVRHGDYLNPTDAIRAAEAVLGCSVTGDVLDLLRSRGTVLSDHDLANVKVPVLLAWAGHDQVLPRSSCSTRLREGIANVTYRVLPGVGHVPMSDDPYLVSRTIHEWISRSYEVDVPLSG